jgi:hypothetical protein
MERWRILVKAYTRTSRPLDAKSRRWRMTLPLPACKRLDLVQLIVGALHQTGYGPFSHWQTLLVPPGEVLTVEEVHFEVPSAEYTMEPVTVQASTDHPQCVCPLGELLVLHQGSW